MNFSVLPPELNAVRLFSGAGSAPMLAAATAWDGLAAELSSAATSFVSITSGLTGTAWQGPSAAAMLAASNPYAGWLSASAAHAERTAAQARAVVAQFEAARAAMVPPAVVSANRSQLAALVISNLFGQNAPAIAAAEAEYEQLWAQAVSTMSGYFAGASAAVSALTPFTQPLQNLVGLPARLTAALQAGGASVATVPAAASRTITLNLGLANVGGGNVGNANVGQGNFGSANLGNSNFGAGNLGSLNYGIGNLGGSNIGFGNAGSGNLGFGNAGNFNIGVASSGNNNIGIGLTGNNLIGIGNTYVSYGPSDIGQLAIGGLNSGTGNIGLFNVNIQPRV